LRYVLDTGNILNDGYTDRHGGGALGFKLSSILNLQDTKTSDNRSTLLWYMVECIEQLAPNILEMARAEMPYLKQASREFIQSAQDEIKDMSGQVQALELAMKKFKPEDSDGLLAIFSSFVARAKSKLQAAIQKLEEIKKKFVTLASYFGEDGEKEDFVMTLVTFCATLEKVWEGVELARQAAEKRAKKEMMQKRRNGQTNRYSVRYSDKSCQESDYKGDAENVLGEHSKISESDSDKMESGTPTRSNGNRGTDTDTTCDTPSPTERRWSVTSNASAKGTTNRSHASFFEDGDGEEEDVPTTTTTRNKPKRRGSLPKSLKFLYKLGKSM